MTKKQILPEIGAPLAGGFFAGEIVVDDVRYALIVAPKAEGEKVGLSYKSKNLAAFDDGLANSDSNHLAAQFCRSLQIGGNNGWYLPSRDELAMMQRNLGPRHKNTPEQFREGAAEAFQPNWYWSSTENAAYSYHAWVVDFSIGVQGSYVKSSNFVVRAVGRLKID